jgi:hypothetical protein
MKYPTSEMFFPGKKREHPPSKSIKLGSGLLFLPFFGTSLAAFLGSGACRILSNAGDETLQPLCWFQAH